MPELPDILSYLEALDTRIMGSTLQKIRITNPFVLRTVTPPVSDLEGKTVLGLQRFGKRIVIDLEGDLHIVIHLMIAGRLKWLTGEKKAGKIALASFQFSTGTLVLTEAGAKRRASIHLVGGDADLQTHRRGGLEVLECTEEEFTERLLSENHTMKRALTDPRLFSGIGNAYSDEILHRARLSPVKLTSKLTAQEIHTLWTAVQETLALWIERLSTKKTGKFPEKVTAFHEEMAAHGRYGKPCPDCGTPIQRIVYAENETNYCPKCQTGGRLLADRALSRLLGGDWPRSLDEMEDKVVALRESKI